MRRLKSFLTPKSDFTCSENVRKSQEAMSTLPFLYQSQSFTKIEIITTTPNSPESIPR